MRMRMAWMAGLVLLGGLGAALGGEAASGPALTKQSVLAELKAAGGVVYRRNEKKEVLQINIAEAPNIYGPVPGEVLEHLVVFDKLETLSIGKRKVNDETLKHLRGLKTLQTLYLPGSEISDAGLESLLSLERLEYLCVGGEGMTPEGIAGLAKLRHLKRLQLNVRLWADDFTCFNALETLELDYVEVTAAQVKQLAGSKTLKRLSIKETRMTEGLADALAGIGSLEELVLGTKVKLDDLELLERLKGLKKLDLRAMGAKEKDVKKLRAALPGCKLELRRSP